MKLEQSLKTLNLTPTITARWIQQLKEPHRHYHTLAHVESLLGWLTPPDATREMIAAIWLHDIVYDPKARDNEELSAQQAIYDLHDSGINVPTVVSLIMGTKHHEPGSNMQNVMNDLDLTILGEARQVYQTYAAQIRGEYAHVPTDVYRPNRALFLRHLNERQIYQTRPYQHLENKAHENLAWEIAVLEE